MSDINISKAVVSARCAFQIACDFCNEYACAQGKAEYAADFAESTRCRAEYEIACALRVEAFTLMETLGI